MKAVSIDVPVITEKDAKLLEDRKAQGLSLWMTLSKGRFQSSENDIAKAYLIGYEIGTSKIS